MNGTPGGMSSRAIALGRGWQVADVICTSGPRDRSFKEEHSGFSVAIVTAGTFQYCASGLRHLMTPGSVMLGNAGQAFECGHEHAAGDRCISFSFDRDYFGSLAADVGARRFSALRLPPLREFASAVARACTPGTVVSWEELGLELAGRSLRLSNGRTWVSTPSAEARVTRVVRMIDREPETGLSLTSMAREARLSPYHFLRTFQRLTGLTPHRYLVRTRLRAAALRLLNDPDVRVLDVALDSGFGDVSNFNRAFRAEFGAAPEAWRYGIGTCSTISIPKPSSATMRRG